MNQVHHLTLQDIFQIRDQIAAGRADADRFDLVNAPGLISALTTPFQAAFGAQAFPDLEDKAAALAFLLVANHPFRDGNKRISGAALALFLQRNGCHLQASAAELRGFTCLCTHARLRDARVRTWVHTHSVQRIGCEAEIR